MDTDDDGYQPSARDTDTFFTTGTLTDDFSEFDELDDDDNSMAVPPGTSPDQQSHPKRGTFDQDYLSQSYPLCWPSLEVG